MMLTSKHRSFLFSLILILSFGVFVSSCYEDTSCDQNIETGMLFSFYKVGTDSVSGEQTLTRNNGNVYVFMQAEKQDTLFPRVADTLAMLPFELNDTVTTLFFEKDSVMDIINIEHTLPEAEFLDVSCGFAPSYTIKTGNFTNTIIDSVVIVNPLVNTDVYQTNIFIYY